MVLSITATPGGGSIAFGRRNLTDALALALRLEGQGYRDVTVTDLDTREVHWPEQTKKQPRQTH